MTLLNSDGYLKYKGIRRVNYKGESTGEERKWRRKSKRKEGRVTDDREKESLQRRRGGRRRK